jgi:hypothetical protein
MSFFNFITTGLSGGGSGIISGVVLQPTKSKNNPKNNNLYIIHSL